MSKRITNNTYYRDEIYIPHAKPSITSDITTVSAELDNFIEEYERECLIKSLGFQLFTLFHTELNSTETNGLDSGADTKWNDLLNGKTYTNPSGNTVTWRGIRYKAKTGDATPTKSFLANYVFWNYEQNFDVFRTGVGTIKSKAANAEVVSQSSKVVRAWRKMSEMIQGREFASKIIIRPVGVGIDYYWDNKEINFYQFIRDINADVTDTYPDFQPGFWDTMVNQFGI